MSITRICATFLLAGVSMPALAAGQEAPTSQGVVEPASPDSENQSPENADAASMSTDDIYRRLFGKDPTPIAAGRYVVIVDALNSGPADIDPTNGWVSSEFARASIIPLLLPEPAAKLDTLLSGPKISFADLKTIGIDAAFDRGQLALIISIPMEMRSARRISINAPSSRGRIAFIPQADYSAYVSVRGGFDIVESGPEKHGFSGFVSRIDLGANIKGISAYARLRYDEDAKHKLTRGDTRLTYDDVGNMIRYELGDLSVGRRPFQLAPRIAGIAAFREYRINPYFQYRTRGEHGFDLDASSRVEILVNGAAVRTLELTAGRYLLSDLPLVSSATNDIELRITSASGEVRTLSFPAFTDIDLLEPGLTEFAANLGLPYRDRDGVRVYDDNDFNFLGFVRHGFSDTLTAGVSLEANKKIALIGGEVSWASPVGTFNVNASMDARNAGVDSSKLELRYAWRTTDVGRGTAIDASVVLTGAEYRALDDLFSGGPVSTVFAQARVGTTLFDDIRIQVGGTYERVRDPQKGERWSLGSALYKQIGPVSLGASVDYQRDRGRSETIGRVSLFVPIGRGTLSSNYSTKNNTARIEYNRSVSSGVGSFGYNLGAERRDGGDRQFARANYIGNRFELSAEQVRTASRGSSDIRSTIAFGTAIVMADGAIAISRPVSNSFAIIENASGEKTKLAIEPRATSGKKTLYSAYADALGPGVIPDLPPYYIRPIEIVAPDAELGSGIGGEIFQLKPGFRSGYRLKVGEGGSSVSALGVMLDRAGTPVALVAGELRETGAPADSIPLQLFTNSSGRFFVEGLKPGKSYEALVNVAGSPVRFSLSVPEDAKGIWKREEAFTLDTEVPHADKN